jgi:hypothetical protein
MIIDTQKFTVANTVFRSGGKRFANTFPAANAEEPGPGTYNLKSSIEVKKPFKARKHEPLLIKAEVPTPVQGPSIPSKLQSYGYDIDPRSGQLTLQDSVYQGYTGNKQDRVGPGDYDPNDDIRFRHHDAAAFGKRSGRNMDLVASRSVAPGPGHYNTITSDFDLFGLNPHTIDSEPGASDFLLALKASRRKPSSVFVSRTSRKIFGDYAHRMELPGPCAYDTKTGMRIGTKPREKQFFNSSSKRFPETARSNRLITAPGSYNPMVSDFDASKIKILKKKKMLTRVGGSDSVAFDTLEKRFSSSDKSNVPPPGKYDIRGMGDALPRRNVRAGAFGSKDKRFRERRPDEDAPIDVAEGVEKMVVGDCRGGPLGVMMKSSVRPHSKIVNPLALSTHQVKGPPNRPAEKDYPYPAPGTYNITSSWDARGVVRVHQPSVKIHREPITPGPGYYDSFKGMGESCDPNCSCGFNRKQVTLGTAARDVPIKTTTPGPGTYIPNSTGTLLKNSFNVYLETAPE